MEKIELRAIEPLDINLIYSWENDPEIWETSNTLVPFSRYVLEQYIISTMGQDIYSAKQLRLMIDLTTDEGRKTIGTIDLFDFEPQHSRAGVGILIDSNLRGKGYGKKALKELINYAFDTLQLHQLYCNININNKTSLKVFQSLGFEIIGIKKDWVKIRHKFEDEYMLQLISR